MKYMFDNFFISSDFHNKKKTTPFSAEAKLLTFIVGDNEELDDVVEEFMEHNVIFFPNRIPFLLFFK